MVLGTYGDCCQDYGVFDDTVCKRDWKSRCSESDHAMVRAPFAEICVAMRNAFVVAMGSQGEGD